MKKLKIKGLTVKELKKVTGMLTVLALFVLLLTPVASQAQQDPQYSQYYFNPLSVNPAYAGSRDAVTFSGLFRRQWLGIPSAPVTQTFSVHTPDGSRRNGFGLNIVNDRISYLGQTWISGSYAYRIPIGKYKLAFGLQGTLFNWRIDWTKAHLIDGGDVVPGSYGNNLWLPNVGFGTFFYGDNAYFGFSIPHMLVNSLSSTNAGISLDDKNTSFAALRRHYFVMGGYVFEINRDFKIKPSFLMKHVYGAPTELDLNLNFYFLNKFGVGASYRTNDGIVALLEYQLSRQLLAGYAYDYPLTPLRNYSSGSHEIFLRYEFSFGKNSVVSPRFF